MTKRKQGSTRPLRRFWTEEEAARMEREYPERPTAELAIEFGCTESRVYAKAAEMGLHKSARFMEPDKCGRIQRGRTDPRMMSTQFKRGHVAWNTGVKGVCGTHPNCRHTQFKKGDPVEGRHNYVPIGSLRLSKDGYLERKMTDDPSIASSRRWVGVHRLVWEAANGPVPKGHVVGFLRGRRSAELEKITLDAVELISRAELARRNHPRSRDPELAKLVQLKGAITRQVNRIAREAQEQES